MVDIAGGTVGDTVAENAVVMEGEMSSGGLLTIQHSYSRSYNILSYNSLINAI